MSKITDRLDAEYAAAIASPPQDRDVVTDIYVHEPKEAKPWFSGLSFRTAWFVEEVTFKPAPPLNFFGIEQPNDAQFIVEQVPPTIGQLKSHDAMKSYPSRNAAIRAMKKNAEPGKAYQIRRVFGLK